MRCTRLAENTGRKKSPKISSSGHHRTTLSGYIFATKAYIENWKKHLNSNIFSTWSHNMVNFGPLPAYIGLPVWGTTGNFNRVSRLAFVTAATSLTGGQPNFARCLPASCPGTLYIYIFGVPVP